jgi:hypothetical protein
MKADPDAGGDRDLVSRSSRDRRETLEHCVSGG